MKNTSLAGQYRMVITKPDGMTIDTGWFDNIITDIGLDRLGNGNSSAGYCRVGTGSSVPAASQQNLDNQIAVSASNPFSSSQINEGAPLYRTTHVFTYTFAQGAVVGNITEVGIGWATTGTTLFSRALIVDGSGNPTTITLVSFDQLTVYYRVRLTPALTDTTGSIVLGGTTYNYTTRPCSVGTFGSVQYLFSGDNFSYISTVNAYQAGSTLGTITAVNPNYSGTPSSGTLTQGTYVSGSFYRDAIVSFSVSQGNLPGGIQVLLFYWGGYSTQKYQMAFNNPIPKDSTKTFTLTMRYSWGRG